RRHPRRRLRQEGLSFIGHSAPPGGAENPQRPASPPGAFLRPIAPDLSCRIPRPTPKSIRRRPPPQTLVSPHVLTQGKAGNPGVTFRLGSVPPVATSWDFARSNSAFIYTARPL